MLNALLKNLGPKALLGLLPMILLAVGNALKGKDQNNTGADDVAGDICLAAAPAIDAFESGNDTALRKALTAIRSAIDAYLAQPHSSTPPAI